MKLINLTPHDINILMKEDQPPFSMSHKTIPKSGKVARCETVNTLIGYMGTTVPIYQTSYGQVTGLPEQQAGVYYLVAAVVAQACKNTRHDLLVPSGFVRDEDGNIIGCTSLSDFSVQGV